MSAIDAMPAHRSPTSRRAAGADRRATRVSAVLAIAITLWVLSLFYLTAQAFAGQSSTGKPAFHPCTRCHPVTIGPDGKPVPPLPNGFEKHKITLEVHDTLGTDDAACLACHDDPTRNPGELVLPDGSLVDIEGDISRVCQRCHSEKYRDWRGGVHGKDLPKCTSAGCHDPHTPSWIYIAALPPFQGTGVEVRAVGADRVPFKPLASAPVPPPVYLPVWLMVMAGLGGLVFAGILSLLIVGRPKS